MTTASERKGRGGRSRSDLEIDNYVTLHITVNSKVGNTLSFPDFNIVTSINMS